MDQKEYKITAKQIQVTWQRPFNMLQQTIPKTNFQITKIES